MTISVSRSRPSAPHRSSHTRRAQRHRGRWSRRPPGRQRRPRLGLEGDRRRLREEEEEPGQGGQRTRSRDDATGRARVRAPGLTSLLDVARSAAALRVAVELVRHER